MPLLGASRNVCGLALADENINEVNINVTKEEVF